MGPAGTERLGPFAAWYDTCIALTPFAGRGRSIKATGAWNDILHPRSLQEPDSATGMGSQMSRKADPDERIRQCACAADRHMVGEIAASTRETRTGLGFVLGAPEFGQGVEKLPSGCHNVTFRSGVRMKSTARISQGQPTLMLNAEAPPIAHRATACLSAARRSVLVAAFCVLPMAWGSAQGQEIPIADEDFKKLDTFEAHQLSKADRVFASQDYRRAAAEYEAFLLQYPKSTATPYAILRRARSLQLDHKRHEAIRTYTEVLDFFPNAISYAAAALYYIGECHWQNGDVKEALKAWAEMARDVDYRKHDLAAGALLRLADALVEEGKAEEAVELYRQAAVEFRKRNPEAARQAMEKGVYHYVRRSPNERKLAEFYSQVQGFGGRAGRTSEQDYWENVMGLVRRYGTFGEQDVEPKRVYYRYWAGVMEGKFPDWDDFQITWASFRLAADGDRQAWIERLNRQFERGPKPADYSRVVQWISLFGTNKAQIEKYYALLDFNRMTGGQIAQLIRTLYEPCGMPDMAKNAFGRLKPDTLTDSQKRELARFLWSRDEGMVETLCRSMTDPDNGRMELLRYYHWRCYHSRQGAEKGLQVADELTSVPRFAKEAYWLKAEILQRTGKFAEAIQAYRSADNPPHNLWRIADCYLTMKKREEALTQLREIENFFKDVAAQAALRIAWVYRDTGDAKQYVANLRGVLKKYPKSAESRQAHLELEQMGIPMGGGVDAE